MRQGFQPLAGPDGGGVSTPGGPRWWRVFNPWRAPMVARETPVGPRWWRVFNPWRTQTVARETQTHLHQARSPLSY